MVDIEDLIIGDIYELIPKSKSGKQIATTKGKCFLIIQKHTECVLFESVKKSAYKRWVNIYYDEHFYLGYKVHGKEEQEK